ncbi:unnamed protein product [Ostreobium quekettii]|uniref:Uncharacterized protein n=1 Tax=Ostreobium quekettii TaxID=121088 RepID=A0A8S1ILQ8_9CHLO|nr:unnamed protein product [Ostreobium quekettii]|eukprot:evm.model.scf_785.1 EVM.evm.TU.scf_785.1   scf_785:6706-8868(+)
MLCGAVHANAAYGYCAMAGHLQSVEKMVMMRTVHNTYFDPVSGASAEANNQAVAALVGVREEDILHAEWENTEFRPCHYVAIDRAQKVLVLAIRCTRACWLLQHMSSAVRQQRWRLQPRLVQAGLSSSLDTLSVVG